MSIRLIHISPELPPTVGGVADYTAILSRRLVEVSDGIIEPVLVHAGNQSAEAIEVDFPTVDLSGERSASALAETIEQLAARSRGIGRRAAGVFRLRVREAGRTGVAGSGPTTCMWRTVFRSSRCSTSCTQQVRYIRVRFGYHLYKDALHHD